MPVISDFRAPPRRDYRSASTRYQRPKRLDAVHQVLRLPHDSMLTEYSSGAWIVRFMRFHGMRSREGLVPAEPTIESFLTDLAVHGHVAAATQDQATHALVCLDTRVLNYAMEGRIKAMRTDKNSTVPVVMTRAAVAGVIALLDGTAQLVATLLSGSGVRIMEAVWINNRHRPCRPPKSPRTPR
jgi:Phage integrase, N-terminal SAM-like domain